MPRHIYRMIITCAPNSPGIATNRFEVLHDGFDNILVLQSGVLNCLGSSEQSLLGEVEGQLSHGEAGQVFLCEVQVANG